MKKSLLALAVLGAFAGAASAQSSVTLYGKIDLGGVYDSGAVPGTNPAGAKSVRISSGVAGGSRLGFRGSEDLGGGLRANFVAETGFCADSAATGGFCTGGGVFMGRQAWVNLSGGFGTIQLGRQYTPGFLNLTTVDPFGTGYAGNAGNLIDSAGLRWNNSVMYSTPAMGGLSVMAGAAAGEQRGNWKAGRQEGFSVSYGAGPVYAGAAYNRVESGTTAPNKTTFNLGGTMAFGAIKGHALYSRSKQGSVLSADDWLLGATFSMGQGSILASYIRHNDKLATNRDANQLAAGYVYALSKRTSLYGAAARIKNKNGAAFTVGNATETGTGKQSLNLGITHNF
jgi:predicted porin